MLLEMVHLSLDGKYLAKGYSNLEYDLATVVYELGGGHCLTALQVTRHLNYDNCSYEPPTNNP